MNRELAACLAIARHACQWRGNQGRNTTTWMFIALALIVPVVAGWFSGQWARSIGYGAGGPLAFLALTWWGILVWSVADQNRYGARLVPGIGRRSVAVLVLSWAVIVSVFTALGWVAGLPPLMVALCAGTSMAALAAVVLVPAMWMFFWPLPIVHWVLPQRWVSVISSVLPDDLILYSIALLGTGFFALRAILRGLPRRVLTMPAGPGQGGVRFMSSGGGAYDRMLARDCARGRIAALLMHACGPGLRGPSWRGFSLFLVAGLAIAFALPAWTAEHSALIRLVVIGSVLIGQITIAPSMMGALYAARGEQALARLAPKLAAPASLNATLARGLLLEYARWWGALTLVGLGLSHAIGSSPGQLLAILVLCLVVLAHAGTVLRDYAAAPDRLSTGRWVEWLILIMLLMLAPGVAIGLVPAAVWLVFGATALTVALVVARIRWNAMLRAPVAFPAGRGN